MCFLEDLLGVRSVEVLLSPLTSRIISLAASFVDLRLFLPLSSRFEVSFFPGVESEGQEAGPALVSVENSWREETRDVPASVLTSEISGLIFLPLQSRTRAMGHSVSLSSSFRFRFRYCLFAGFDFARSHRRERARSSDWRCPH